MFSQPLIGSVGLILHEVAVKLKNDYTSPMLCTLASNNFTYFKLQGDGNLKKTYSPLKVYVLSWPLKLVHLADLQIEIDKYQNSSMCASQNNTSFCDGFNFPDDML